MSDRPDSAPSPTSMEGSFEGVDAIVLQAGHYTATFLPELGMLGASLTCDGHEYLSLHGGVDGYRGGHTTGIPLLHPWANRLGRLTYEVGGTWVDIDPTPPVHLVDGLPIHGTMTAAPGWRVEAHLADASRALLQCRYEFGADPVRLASFPFPHDIVVFVELSDRGLRITTTIHPTGSVAVPLSFGWHPYLTLPGVVRADLSADLPPREVIELDARMLPTGGQRDVEATTVLLGDGPMENVLDDAYRLGDAVTDRTFVLRGPDDAGVERSVRVEVGEGYSHAQAYAPRGRAFAAFEPMTAPINALVSGDHRFVEPGGQFSATFTIAVPAFDPPSVRDAVEVPEDPDSPDQVGAASDPHP
jgi:galactose mutarotase-like enzyme